MKLFISICLTCLLWNCAYSEETIDSYETIKLSSGFRSPMEFNKLTGVFGEYEPDKAFGIRVSAVEEYTGELKEGKPDGKGVSKGADNYYKGEWKSGKYHGYGEFSQPRSGFEYFGEWSNGLKEGKGTLKYPWRIF